MRNKERRLAQEAKAMTRLEVLKRAQEGHITWQQAASICRLSSRHLRRLRHRLGMEGPDALRDGRAGRSVRSRRIPGKVVQKILELRRGKYSEFNVRHFHEFLQEQHDVRVGYTFTKELLQAHGLADKAPGRGRYRRRRERRPMRGMLIHLDGSTHEWIPGLPKYDLNVALDDADGRILFARFVEEEGTVSTLEAFEHILKRWGRFCEFYTDAGSHFCTTSRAGQGPDAEQSTQVARVLQVLGIRHIVARSPEARGRSERCFGTLQGRLPQELKAAGIDNYHDANRYLTQRFIPSFDRKFTVKPAQPESAFVPIAGLDLELLLSVQHDRVVRKDNTVAFKNLALQLPPQPDRTHLVRCPVVVHELLNHTLAVSYQGNVVGRFARDGSPLTRTRRKRQGKAA